MRVSTLMSHHTAVRTMTSQEDKLLHTMQQVASGKRVLTPSDDPLASSLSVNLAQTKSMNARYAENREIARQNLSTEEQTLTSVSNMLQDVLTRIVEAGNEVYSDADRQMLAGVLKEMRSTLMGLANATDGTGQYLFSGNLGNVAPFDPVMGTINPGVQGTRDIQVTQSRVMPSASTAVEVFNRVAPGAQVYVAQADLANTGSVTFKGPEVADVTQVLDETFTISFDDTSGSWEVVINYGANEIRLPYESGRNIEFAGLRLTLEGEPAAGDTITISPAEVNLFPDLDRLIEVLEAPTAGDPGAMARLRNELATANRKINLVLDNVLTVRASIGARMNELDALDEEGSYRDLIYASQLSQLEDLDYRQASSDLAVRSMALQAAELAYMKVQNLGLFSRR